MYMHSYSSNAIDTKSIFVRGEGLDFEILTTIMYESLACGSCIVHYIVVD